MAVVTARPSPAAAEEYYNVKAAIRSLVVAVALATSASSVDAGPPRYSANHSVPIQTLPSLNQERYGEPLPYSAPGSAFSTYGVAYPAPAYRNYPNVPPPRTVIGGSNIGYYGTFRDRRR